MSKKTLNAAVEIARRDYFPDWDIEGEWRFSEMSKENQRWGNCDCGWKMIVINESVTGTKRLATVIHEICHAIVNRKYAGHPDYWQRLMIHAALIASLNKNSSLAASLLISLEQHR